MGIRCKCFAVATIVIGVLTGCGRQQLLDGKWAHTRRYDAFAKQWDDKPRGTYYEFRGDRYAIVSEAGVVESGTFEVDLTKFPRRLTAKIETAPTIGRVQRSIYKLEGNKLTIVTNLTPDVDRYPESFEPSDKITLLLREFERVE